MSTLTSFNFHADTGALEVEAQRVTSLGEGPDHFTVRICADHHYVVIFLKSMEELDALADKVSQSVLDVRLQAQAAV